TGGSLRKWRGWPLQWPLLIHLSERASKRHLRPVDRSGKGSLHDGRGSAEDWPHVVRQGMASLQVGAIVDSNPDPVCFVLAHEDLERQIDRRFRRSLHYTSAGSRVAEEKEGGRPQFEAG